MKRIKKKKHKLTRYMISNLNLFSIIILCGTIIFIATPILINFLYSDNLNFTIITTKWEAEYALSYAGGALASFGTLVLGLLTWKQTQSQRMIEYDNFIANNSCMVLVEKLEFQDLKNIHNPTICPEQVVKESSIAKGCYKINDLRSFSIVLYLRRLEHYAAMVHICNLDIRVEDVDSENSKYQPLSLDGFHEFDERYSKIAISNNQDKIHITVMSLPETSKKLVDAVNTGRKIELDITLILATPNYVATEIMCRSVFEEKKSLGKNVYLSDENPICFWRGNDILDANKVQFRIED